MKKNDMAFYAKGYYIIVSAVLIAAGLLMMLFPSFVSGIIGIITGAALIITGTAKIVGYFSGEKYGLAFQFDLGLGIASLIAGIVIAVTPKAVLGTIVALIGFMEIINGAMRIQTAFDARRFGISRWWIMLVVAVLSVGIGGFLLFNPVKSSETILVIVGVSLLISGILHIITALITVKKRPNKKDTANVYEADYRDL